MSRTPKNKTEKGGVVIPVSANVESVKGNTGIVNEGSGVGVGVGVGVGGNCAENCQGIVPEIPPEKPKGEPLLKKVFECGARIVGLAGSGSSGKTNCLIYLLLDFHQHCPDIEIYVYGLGEFVTNWTIKNLNAIEISSIDHLSSRSNSIICIDECHLLNLSSRKHQEEISAFAAFINHSNNFCILSTANTREFNLNLGSIVDKWLIKTLKFDSLINGSPLKKALINYRGRFKRLKDVIVPIGKLLILSEDREVILDIPYLKEIDTKMNLSDLFSCN